MSCGRQVECCKLAHDLCLDADIADALDEYGAIKRAADAMQTHWDDVPIQILVCKLFVRYIGERPQQ